MKYALLAAACMYFFLDVLTGQVIYISSSGNALYRLNLDNCSYSFVTQINRQVYDIGFHPDGSLYGISGNGNFFSIDTLTGQTNLIHDFGGQTYNSLTLASDGLVYTIGNDGELWTYDLVSGVEAYLGDIGFPATGDLTFYKGELFVAATGDRIVRINLGMVANSSVIINEDIPGNILGIVSDVVNCTEINCYAITNGNSDIYKINFMTNSLELVCELNITIGGGASSSEFLASSPLMIDSTILINPDCTNQNGEVEIMASGGSGVYTYSLNGGTPQLSNIFTLVPEGNYTAIVYDQLGCEDTTTFMLINFSALYIDTILSQPAACGEDNGTITVLASGGTGNFNYALNGGLLQSLNIFSSLPGGQYNIVVVDQAGCKDSLNWMLQMADAPILNDLIIQHNTCGLNNGSIMAVASGGSGSLLYSIDNIQFQTSPLFSDLGSGIYPLFIIDSVGCLISEMAQIDAVVAASIIDVDYMHPSCGGVSGGTIQIFTDITDDIIYSIDGIQFQSGDSFDNLGEGTYLLTIQDANECIDTMSLSLWMSSFPQLTNVTMTPEHCGMKDGSLIFTSIGGTGTHQYALNGAPYQPSNTFINLPAGWYEIEIRDDAGCSFMDEVEVESVEGFAITDIATTPALCGETSGSISVNVEGGTLPLLYTLNNNLSPEEGMFTDLAAGSYKIQIKDAAGCTSDTMLTVSRSGCPIYIPNVFSPNGDGENDFFQISTVDENNVLITKFFIFDRWGNDVYERFNLPIQSTEGWWDGKFKHFTANPGVFAYYLEIELENGERETYKGSVTLIR